MELHWLAFVYEQMNSTMRSFLLMGGEVVWDGHTAIEELRLRLQCILRFRVRGPRYGDWIVFALVSILHTVCLSRQVGGPSYLGMNFSETY
jgi:hypothetical protein